MLGQMHCRGICVSSNLVTAFTRFFMEALCTSCHARFAGFRPSDDLAHAFPGVWLFVRCRYAFERAFVCFLGSFLLYLVFRLWRVLLLPFPFCDGLGRSGHCKQGNCNRGYNGSHFKVLPYLDCMLVAFFNKLSVV